MTRSSRALLGALASASAFALPAAPALAGGLDWEGRSSADGLARAETTTAGWSQATYTVAEGDTLTASLVKTGPEGGSANFFAFTPSDGTATSGEDYGAAPNPASTTFAPSDTAKSVGLAVIEDEVDEVDERLLLCWTPGNGSTLGFAGSNCATVVITDDDAPNAGAPSQIAFAGTGSGAAEVDQQLTVAVTKTGPAAGSVTVTMGGSATRGFAKVNGVDWRLEDPFSPAAGGTTRTISFGAGPQTVQFPVTIFSDTVSDPNETVQLTLSDPTAGLQLGSRTSHTVSILEPGTPPPPPPSGDVGFTLGGFDVDEDEAVLEYEVTKTGPSTGSVSLGVGSPVSGSPATPDVDYELLTEGPLVFDQPGTQTRTVQVRVLDDAIEEQDETALVVLSSASGLTIDGARQVSPLTIRDDDDAAPPASQVVLDAASYTVDEGDALTVQALKSGAATGSMTLVSDVLGANTADDEDVGPVSPSGTLTFGTPEGLQERTIATTDDSVDEPNETFQVRLTDDPTPDGLAVGTPDVATVTIVDDDGPPAATPAVTIAPKGTVSETSGVQEFTLSKGAGGTGSVRVAFSGSATRVFAPGTGDYRVGVAGEPHVEKPLVEFDEAGAQTKTVRVTVFTDQVSPEPNETVVATLEQPSGVALTPPVSSTLTIADVPPTPNPPAEYPSTAVRFEAASASVDEDDRSVAVSLRKDGPGAGSVSLAVGGTATVGQDLLAPASTVTFAASEAQKTVFFTLKEDAADEPDETVVLTLGAPSGGLVVGSPSSHTVTVRDDDPAPTTPPADTGGGGGGGGGEQPPAQQPPGPQPPTPSPVTVTGGTPPTGLRPGGTLGGVQAFVPLAQTLTVPPGGTIPGPGFRATQNGTKLAAKAAIGDGSVTIAAASKKKRRITLKPVSATLSAGQLLVLKPKLTAAQRKAVKKLKRPSVAFKVTITPPGKKAETKLYRYRLKIR